MNWLLGALTPVRLKWRGVCPPLACTHTKQTTPQPDNVIKALFVHKLSQSSACLTKQCEFALSPIHEMCSSVEFWIKLYTRSIEGKGSERLHTTLLHALFIHKELSAEQWH